MINRTRVTFFVIAVPVILMILLALLFLGSGGPFLGPGIGTELAPYGASPR